MKSESLLGTLLRGGLSKLPGLGDRVGRLSLYLGLLLAALPIVRLPGNVGSIADPFLVFAFVCAVCLSPQGHGLDLRAFKLHALGVLLVVVGVVLSTVAEASQQWQSLLNLLKFLMAVPFVVFTCAALLQDRRHLRIAIACFVTSVVITCLAAILQASLGSGGSRMAGLTANPNGLGTVGAIAIALGLFLAFRAAGLVRVLWLVMVVLCVTGVMLSGSRAGALGAVLAVVLWAAATYRFDRQFVTVVVVCFLAAAAMSGYAFVEWGGGRLASSRLVFATDPYADRAVASRLNQYDIVLERVSQNPFLGVGLAHDDIEIDGTQVHNFFLLTLQGGGLLALAGIILILFDLFQKGLKTFRRSSTPETKVMAMSLSIASAVMVATGMFGPLLYQREKWVPSALLFTCVVLVHQRRRKKTHVRRRSASRTLGVSTRVEAQ